MSSHPVTGIEDGRKVIPPRGCWRCLSDAMPGLPENIRRTVARSRAESCHCNMGNMWISSMEL